MTTTKTCTECGETKHLDDFPRNRTRADGRGSRCSACNRAAVRAWKAANPDRVRQQKRARRARQREEAAR